MAEDTKELVELTAGVVAAYVASNTVASSELPSLIKSVHDALGDAGKPEAEPEVSTKATAAQIRKSITPDALVSFEDGKPYKSLRRHLSTRGLSPDEYKAKYGLPKDYPMVAPSYSAQRSELAKKLGLGNRRAAEPPPPPAAKRGRGKAKKSPTGEAAPA